MKQDRDRYNEEQEDAELVASVLAGKREAFDILLLRYMESVLRLCGTLLGTSAEAQDVAQEAALQAYLGLARLREPERFAAWFHAIAANLARSALRRRREFSMHTLDEDATVCWIDAPPTLEEYQEERELYEAVRLALGALSEVNRQAVIGFYLHGYSYKELAQLLNISVGTVKGRLFQGRQQLKTSLHPLFQPLKRPGKKEHPLAKHRKEQHMTTSLSQVELQLDSLRSLLITRQQLVILRDTQSERGIPIPLTAREAEALDLAYRDRYSPLPFSLDLSQRLLESLDTQLQQVMINALAGQTLYATLTIKQGEQTHEVDARLSEVLALAVRMNAPISITRSLFEAAATLDLTTQAAPSSPEELETRIKGMQHMGREERLQLEEDARNTKMILSRRKVEHSAELFWSFLLENLTGTREAVSIAELRVLDLTTTFPTRTITLDEQALVAIRLPNQREAAWLLVQSATWDEITRGVRRFQEPEQPAEHTQEQAKPLPAILPPPVLQRVSESLARLIADPDLRTAFLLNPEGTPVAWLGADSLETVQRFSVRHANARRNPLANEHELQQQSGLQPEKASFLGTFDKKAMRQDLPKEAGGIMGAKVYAGGWEMLVIFEEKNMRDLQEETHQHLDQARQELKAILAQTVSDQAHP